MRVILLGAGGMLGRELGHSKPTSVLLYSFARAELDITNSTLLKKVVSDLRPEVIVNAAAYTAVDVAESERDKAFRVNAEAVGALGEIARKADARVIHFSTDYVFDGTANKPYTEDNPTNPINAYGASKLAGEVALRQSEPHCLIIRTQWLFGAHGKSFPRTMLERARLRLPSRVVSDQIGRPSFAVDIAHAVWKLIALDVRGTVHVANNGMTSWYEVARYVYASLDASDLVQECSTSQYPSGAKRPLYSALDLSRAEKTLGGPLPLWPDALDRFMASIATTPDSSTPNA